MVNLVIGITLVICSIIMLIHEAKVHEDCLKNRCSLHKSQVVTKVCDGVISITVIFILISIITY